MNLQSAGHANRILAAVDSQAAAQSSLVASWRRSAALHRLDPAELSTPQRLTDNELRFARQRIAPLIDAAQASLDRLYLAVGGIGCSVLLADRDGIPVERRGAPADDETFQEWGLWTGAVWSEASEGTNGIGTCLVERRLLTIHRDQHFLSRNVALSCTCAPIHDHEGRLAAALDVSSCRADLTGRFVELIALATGEAARQIEIEAFRRAFSHARVMLAPIARQSVAALIAVDADDLVIGATRAARQALALDDGRLSCPLPVSDLIGEPVRPSDRFADAERGALCRELARSGGNVSAAARQLGISRATMHRKLARHGIRTHH